MEVDNLGRTKRTIDLSWRRQKDLWVIILKMDQKIQFDWIKTKR